MKIFTIGFKGKSAEEFFEILKENGVVTVIDVRLNNSSQFAGFTKVTHLPYLLKEIGGIEYLHLKILAPTPELRQEKNWEIYQKKFNALLEKRKVENSLWNKELLACLLCSEVKPDHCHRRLIAEYLKDKWKNIEIIHL